MVKINMAGFKPVEFKFGRLSLKSGGHLNKETGLTTKDIGNNTFIQIKSRDAWLQAATMGKTTRGEMYTGVLDDLRNIVLEMEMKMRRKSPVFDSFEKGIRCVGADPMDEMEDIVPVDPHSPVRFKKLQRASGSFPGQVCHIKMDEYPEEARTGGARKKREISVYIEGTKKLWLDKNDLQWLLQYLWIQQQLKGVAAVASDDEGPDGPKRSEIDMTPEKLPAPQQVEGNLHDKWAEAP